MSMLNFTPTADGKRQAVFSTSTAFLLQMSHDNSDSPVSVTVKARLDDSLPYSILRILAGVGKSAIIPLNAGADMQILVESSEPTLRAAFTPLSSSSGGGGASAAELASLQQELSRQSSINDTQQQQIDANTSLNSAQEEGLGDAETTRILNNIFGNS